MNIRIFEIGRRIPARRRVDGQPCIGGQPRIQSRVGSPRRVGGFGRPLALGLALLTGLIFSVELSAQFQGDGEGSGFRSPQEIDGSRKLPTDRSDGSDGVDGPDRIAGESDNAGKAGANGASANDLPQNASGVGPQGQRVFDALFLELDNMIPGEFEDGSDTKKSVEEVVTAFQTRNMRRAEEILKELESQDAHFPPSDLLLASLSYAVKDSDTGLALLERAAVVKPKYPGVYSAFARLAVNQGRTSDALAMFEKCGRVIGGAKDLDPVSRKHFEEQCLDGLLDIAMRQKRYGDAKNYLERLRKTLPENAKVLMVSAELEFLDENIGASIKYLEQLKSKYPTSRAVESVLASWYQQSGKPKEAEEWIQTAAEKHPDSAQVQLEYASWAVSQEQFPAASVAIHHAEKATGESPFSRNLKGKIAFCKQAFGAAELHYEAIVKKQPNRFDSANMYVLCLIESKDPEKRKLALELAMRNIRSLPDNQVAQAALGYVELRLGNTDRAKAVLAHVARTPGSAPEIDFFLASLLEKVGNEKQAVLVLEGVLKHQGVFLYRAAAKKLLGRLNKVSDALPEPGQ